MNKKLSVLEDMAISHLQSGEIPTIAYSPGDWIRIVRTYLRMTQVELAKRAKIPQSHVAAIESGKLDPRVSTLNKIFTAIFCPMGIEPRPGKPLKEILRVRARSVALRRLKQSMGTMALENQSPHEAIFRRLLEKKTNEILNDPHERLWDKTNED